MGKRTGGTLLSRLSGEKENNNNRNKVLGFYMGDSMVTFDLTHLGQFVGKLHYLKSYHLFLILEIKRTENCMFI